MAYNRSAVQNYAKKHWNIPCDDEKIANNKAAGGFVNLNDLRMRYHAPASDWDAVFIWKENRDEKKPDHQGWETLCFKHRTKSDVIRTHVDDDGNEDCTHYLHRCLTAGGITVPPTAWAPTMVSSLKTLQNTKTLGERLDLTAAERVMATQMVKAGDVIAYWEKGNYQHMAVRVERDGISCHTWCRYNGPGPTDNWRLNGQGHHRQYTFIHFSDDDPPNSGLAPTLIGWWAAEAIGKPWFYFFEWNGKVTWTPNQPRPGSPPPADPTRSGYWFRNNDRLLVIWTATGSVEDYSLPGALNPGNSGICKGTWNNAPISMGRLS